MSIEYNLPDSFVNLEDRIQNLKSHFSLETLKSKSLELEPLNECDGDHVRAYIALCHAEFESYLEQRATDIVDEALSLWNNEKKATLPLMALFAHFEYIEKNVSTTQKIYMIVSLFKQNVIKKNNGLKGDNIKKLFVPIGVDFETIDSAWISTLDSYGVMRGATVHMSAMVQQALDVHTVLATTKIVKDGIENFEELLDGLIN